MLQIVRFALPNLEIHAQIQINNPSVFVYIERPEWGCAAYSRRSTRKKTREKSPLPLYISYIRFGKDREEKNATVSHDWLSAHGTREEASTGERARNNTERDGGVLGLPSLAATILG